MSLVFFIYDYGEYGPEKMIFSDTRQGLVDKAENDEDFAWSENRYGVLSNLKTIFEFKTDEQLLTEHKDWPLCDGWGGFVFRADKLD